MCKYVVIDLEMCKVPKNIRTESYRWSQETIQIGAVLLNENYEVVDTFCTYVFPENGQIDSFIQELTGISVKMTAKAPMMQDALKKFACWLPDEEIKAVSWSDSDKRQICKEMEAKGIKLERIEALFEDWIDCQKIFGEKIGVDRLFKLSEALNSVYIDTIGCQHDGLADAYNTALLFAKMEQDQVLQFNSTYIDAILSEKKHLYFSLGELFSGMNLELCVQA